MSGPSDHRHIVVGIDGSRGALNAAAWATEIAALHRVPLRLLCVHDPPNTSERSSRTTGARAPTRPGRAQAPHRGRRRRPPRCCLGTDTSREHRDQDGNAGRNVLHHTARGRRCGRPSGPRCPKRFVLRQRITGDDRGADRTRSLPRCGGPGRISPYWRAGRDRSSIGVRTGRSPLRLSLRAPARVLTACCSLRPSRSGFIGTGNRARRGFERGSRSSRYMVGAGRGPLPRCRGGPDHHRDTRGCGVGPLLVVGRVGGGRARRPPSTPRNPRPHGHERFYARDVPRHLCRSTPARSVSEGVSQAPAAERLGRRR